MTDPRPLVPFLVVMAGLAVFGAMDALMKELVPLIGVYSALLWRTLIGLPITGAIYAASYRAPPGRVAMRFHVMRGAVSTAMALLFFWGLARLPMAQAIALSFIAPLLALLLAAVLLKEAISRRTVFAMLVAMMGVLVIVGGHAETEAGDDALLGALAVLASALCYAWNIILMRQQALVALPAEIAFFQAVVIGAILLAAAPVLGAVPPVALLDEIAAAALFTTISMLLLSWGYARAPASYLASTEYTAFIWAALLGWLVFGEGLSLHTLAGTALIIVGVAWGTRATARPPAVPQPVG